MSAKRRSLSSRSTKTLTEDAVDELEEDLHQFSSKEQELKRRMDALLNAFARIARKAQKQSSDDSNKKSTSAENLEELQEEMDKLLNEFAFLYDEKELAQQRKHPPVVMEVPDSPADPQLQTLERGQRESIRNLDSCIQRLSELEVTVAKMDDEIKNVARRKSVELMEKDSSVQGIKSEIAEMKKDKQSLESRLSDSSEKRKQIEAEHQRLTKEIRASFLEKYVEFQRKTKEISENEALIASINEELEKLDLEEALVADIDIQAKELLEAEQVVDVSEVHTNPPQGEEGKGSDKTDYEINVSGDKNEENEGSKQSSGDSKEVDSDEVEEPFKDIMEANEKLKRMTEEKKALDSIIRSSKMQIDSYDKQLQFLHEQLRETEAKITRSIIDTDPEVQKMRSKQARLSQRMEKESLKKSSIKEEILNKGKDIEAYHEENEAEATYGETLDYLRETLSNQLHCSSCRGQLSDTRMLPCGHLFCHSCAEELRSNTEAAAICATCQERFPCDAKVFPRIEGQLFFLSTSLKSRDAVARCAVHGLSEGLFCLDCMRRACLLCTEDTHRDHTLVTWPQFVETQFRMSYTAEGVSRLTRALREEEAELRRLAEERLPVVCGGLRVEQGRAAIQLQQIEAVLAEAGGPGDDHDAGGEGPKKSCGSVPLEEIPRKTAMLLKELFVTASDFPSSLTAESLEWGSETAQQLLQYYQSKLAGIEEGRRRRDQVRQHFLLQRERRQSAREARSKSMAPFVHSPPNDLRECLVVDLEEDSVDIVRMHEQADHSTIYCVSGDESRVKAIEVRNLSSDVIAAIDLREFKVKELEVCSGQLFAVIELLNQGDKINQAIWKLSKSAQMESEVDTSKLIKENSWLISGLEEQLFVLVSNTPHLHRFHRGVWREKLDLRRSCVANCVQATQSLALIGEYGTHVIRVYHWKAKGCPEVYKLESALYGRGVLLNNWLVSRDVESKRRLTVRNVAQPDLPPAPLNVGFPHVPVQALGPDTLLALDLEAQRCVVLQLNHTQ